MAERADALILMCSLETIKKYVPSVSVSSSGGMGQADRIRAITTLFADFIQPSVVEQWVKSGCVVSYIVMQRPIQKQLVEVIARQDAANSGVPADLLRKASTHPMESRKTDRDHPAYLVIITSPI